MARKGKGEGVDGYIEPMQLMFFGEVTTRIVLKRHSDGENVLPRDYLDVYEEYGSEGTEHKEKIRHVFHTSDTRIELAEVGCMLEDPTNGLHVRFNLSNRPEDEGITDWPDPMTMADTARMITITIFPDGVEIIE